MNWTKSSRGDWVAFDGKNSYTISRVVAYEKVAPGSTMVKSAYVWRMRINGAQVGWFDKCALWKRVSDVKAYAEDRARR